jgi:Ser/Thr protein kinase RdoA (MazF antagonist)
MEANIRALYNENILEEACRRYGIAPDQLRQLDGFESFVIEFWRAGGDFILRIGHSQRRSEALIQGEVDWINYLAAHGASVSRAILSQTGKLVEKIDDGQGGHFLATAFVKAPGASAWEQNIWGDDLFLRYGKLIGRLHALSRDYIVSNPAWQRPAWDDPLMLDVEAWLPASQTIVLDRFHRLMDTLHMLPKDRGSYGLIHQDAHGGNFFVDDQGTITLFDFDDCVHSWYANDIAIVLFYAVTNVDNPDAFGQRFLEHFLRGYQRENQLDPQWLATIPYFLKLREIDLYAVIHRSFDVHNLRDPWVAGFMKDRGTRIEQNVPCVNIDFDRLLLELGQF